MIDARSAIRDGGGQRILVTCRRKGRSRYGTPRLSASRRSASGHAFGIVSRIGLCSLRLLARILRASRQRRAVQIVHSPAAPPTISIPATTSRDHAGEPLRRTPCVRIMKASQKVK
jgi:hypothetical protein